MKISESEKQSLVGISSGVLEFSLINDDLRIDRRRREGKAIANEDHINDRHTDIWNRFWTDENQLS